MVFSLSGLNFKTFWPVKSSREQRNKGGGENDRAGVCGAVSLDGGAGAGAGEDAGAAVPGPGPAVRGSLIRTAGREPPDLRGRGAKTKAAQKSSGPREGFCRKSWCKAGRRRV